MFLLEIEGAPNPNNCEKHCLLKNEKSEMINGKENKDEKKSFLGKVNNIFGKIADKIDELLPKY